MQSSSHELSTSVTDKRICKYIRKNFIHLRGK